MLQLKAQDTIKDIKMIRQNNTSVIQIPTYKQKIILRGALLSEVYRTRNKLNEIMLQEQAKAMDQYSLSNNKLRLQIISLNDVILNDSLLIATKDVEIKGLKKTIVKQKVKIYAMGIGWLLSVVGVGYFLSK